MFSLFNDIILYLLTPLLLLGILWQLYKLVRHSEAQKQTMRIWGGIILGWVVGLVLWYVNSQYLHFDYRSYDPFAFLLGSMLWFSCS